MEVFHFLLLTWEFPQQSVISTGIDRYIYILISISNLIIIVVKTWLINDYIYGSGKMA